MPAVPHPTNAVLVGRKPVRNYVAAVMRLFADEGMREVVVKARGSNVYKAVETVEMFKMLFRGSVVVKSISIGSELVEAPGGESKRVSSIEIVLARR